MKITKLHFTLLFLAIGTLSSAQTSVSPYEWDWKIDGPWLGVGLGGTAGGLLTIQNKNRFTETELNILNKDDVFFVDRWSAGYSSERASTLSDYPFYSSFAVPFVLLLDGKVNDHTAQVMGLYIESLSTTSAMFTLTAGLVNRTRPLVYSDEVGLGEKMRNTNRRSFYSGHVAASATAMFFAAKVFSDFNPDSKLKPYFWTAAFTVPAVVGYFRIRAGKHFLTDVVLGYTLGALTGYLVPELHRKKNHSIQLSPSASRTPLGDNVKGIRCSLSF